MDRLVSIEHLGQRGVFAFACPYIVSTGGHIGNCTVTQMRHPLDMLKDDQAAFDHRLPVHCRRFRSLQHPTVIPVARVTPCLLNPCIKLPEHLSCTAVLQIVPEDKRDFEIERVSEREIEKERSGNIVDIEAWECTRGCARMLRPRIRLEDWNWIH